MNRFFAVVKGYERHGVNLPKRSTERSAGYDFEAVEDVVIPSIWKSYTDLIKRVPEKDSPLGQSPEFFTMYGSRFRTGFKPTLVKTGVKASMQPDECLKLLNRSSNPKKGLLLSNGVGLVDADYFENSGNDGHIMFSFINFGEHDFKIEKGDRIGQGVFEKYLTTDDDNSKGDRVGGFGSTNTK